MLRNPAIPRQERTRFRWVKGQLADQIVYRPSVPGFVPTDIETGYMGRHGVYAALAETLLRNNADVILGERRGFGGTTPHEGGADIDKHVELKKQRLDAYRREIGNPHQKFVHVGHSMGGAITIAFAAKYPEYVASIIDIGAIGDPHPDWSIFEWHAKGLRSIAPTSVNPARLVPYLGMAARTSLDAVESLVWHPIEVSRHAFICMNLDNTEAEQKVGEHGLSVTVIRGEDDEWVPAESLHARAERMRVPRKLQYPLMGRWTIQDQNHLLGNTVPADLTTILGAHMDAAVDVQIMAPRPSWTAERLGAVPLLEHPGLHRSPTDESVRASTLELS